ncbi:hypothetical protein C2W62_09820 [Candidatus Entotheonella serta]|nr:hypothetical protein C2W62_09820 [Candidatus Entotheonella serta]
MFALVLGSASAILFGGLLLYIFALAMAYIFNPSFLQPFKRSVEINGQLTIGLPLATLAAFALVSVFWKFMPEVDKEPLSLTVFGLEFSGPSGPITLWIACFLAFVAAMKAFSK